MLTKLTGFENKKKKIAGLQSPKLPSGHATELVWSNYVSDLLKNKDAVLMVSNNHTRAGTTEKIKFNMQKL